MRNSFVRAGFAFGLGAVFGKWFADGCIEIIEEGVARAMIKKANEGSPFAQTVCDRCNIDYRKYKNVVMESKIIDFHY